ncbi:MAG TPA: AMP-binding protein [Actinomycetota bacterium]|jgi:acetyl-CoA synthetase|nr:AMP-binding protein [Actinomycetota bacterium]
MSDFIWEPSPDYVEKANVTRLMRKHGIDDFHELVRRSHEDIEWFWEAVIEDLGIVFAKPYEKLLETGDGVQWPRWFSGARINLSVNCIDRHLESGGDRPAIIWEGEDGATRHLTYLDLYREVSRVANGLTANGIGPGDAVGVYLPMIPEAMIAAHAIARIGAVYLPIFSGFGAPAILTRLEDAGAKALITADGFLRRGSRVPMKQTADEAAASCSTLEKVFVVRRFADEPCPMGDRDVDWTGAFGSQPAEHQAPELDPETPFLLAYTSGTTGKPKGSVHVHGGFLVKIAEEAAYQVDARPGEVLYWVTDMGWIMGPWEMVGGHANGAAVFIYEGAPNHPGPDRLWDMVERHRVTILGISPTLVRALMPAGEEPVQRHDLSSLRILGSTGEPWNPEPYRWFARVVGGGRCPIINLSGGTEVGACFLGQSPVIPTKVCSLGTPSLGMAMEVFDADGAPVRGEVGELVCLKPWPSQTRGFWNAPERYLDAYWRRWEDVWVHGDWASIDEDGYWFLHGRSDDTLNIAGKRIGPAEFESAAVGHEAVVECAAIGVPDEVKGTAVWLFCIPRPGTTPDESLRREVEAAVVSELGKAFKPAEIRFVEELPKTRSAKILRRAIRARVLGEDAGDLSSLENPGALEAIEKALHVSPAS